MHIFYHSLSVLGMLCPLDIIGYLIALQADPVSEIRSEALRILQIQDDRHPNFIDNRLIEGQHTLMCLSYYIEYCETRWFLFD